MDTETVIMLTADIVSAHVGNNNVGLDDLPHLIQSVFTALTNAGAEVHAEVEKLTPAVSLRSSVKPDAIACLDCGKKFKMLKRHLSTDHGLTPLDYRTRWNLSADYPLVASEYSAKRKDLAVQIGLGRKLGAKRKPGRPRKAPAIA